MSSLNPSLKPLYYLTASLWFRFPWDKLHSLNRSEVHRGRVRVPKAREWFSCVARFRSIMWSVSVLIVSLCICQPRSLKYWFHFLWLFCAADVRMVSAKDEKKKDIEKLINSYTVNKYNFISLTDLDLCPSKQYIVASRQDVTPFYGLYSSFLPQNSLIHSFIYSYIFFFNSSLKHRSVERISNSHPSIFCQPKKNGAIACSQNRNTLHVYHGSQKKKKKPIFPLLFHARQCFSRVVISAFRDK